MKRITYRGGILEFTLPANWVEEYEDEGGATFYEDRPDSGTLRLNVLGFEGPETITASDMVRTVFRPEEGMSDEDFQDGLRLRTYIAPASEKGEALAIYRWHVAVPIMPRSLRLVIFAHTIVCGQENDDSISQELRIIDSSIRSGFYSREAGVSGAFRHSA
ncbi:hypothetical protein [Brevifollis gellanilyticus]|nr:hypothetical protein [Brevifollis gellanilyticus]